MVGISRHMQAQAGPAQSVIGPDMRVSGSCEFQGGLQIQGQVLGPVTGILSAAGVPSSLRIEAGAEVEGEISADHASIAGTVLGSVLVRGRLELLPTARVQGDVIYTDLDMRPGAQVTGLLQPQMVPRSQPETPPPPPEAPQSSPTSAAAHAGARQEPVFEASGLDPQTQMPTQESPEPAFELEPDDPK